MSETIEFDLEKETHTPVQIDTTYSSSEHISFSLDPSYTGSLDVIKTSKTTTNYT